MLFHTMDIQRNVRKEVGKMKSNSLTDKPEDLGFTVFTIRNELYFDDLLMKIQRMIKAPKDKVWLNLSGITKTDITSTSIYILSSFVEKHEDSIAKSRVVIVADTDLSHVIVKTTLSLLGIDGFKRQIQLFSSKKAALGWMKLVNLLSSS
jgi:hypothetical protein